MTLQQQLLKQILQQHGQSVTFGRQLLIDILWEQKPLTISQVVHKVDGRIDRASIYRTIKLFEKIGIIQRINIGWKYQIELAGPFSHHHHHLSCLNCHKMVAITDQELEKAIHAVANEHSFSLQQHQLEIQGYCQKCRPKIERSG